VNPATTWSPTANAPALATIDLRVAAIAAVGAVLALCGFLAILATGHLDEDAYILFTYSEHLAHGQGIVWDFVHGPCEGATDFLWMVLLAGLQLLGLDVGAGAALLNTVGWTLSYYSIARTANLQSVPLHLLLAVALLLSHMTAASLGGFSTFFYCGVFAVCCFLAVSRDYRRLAFALLVLALVRPDGVLLALGLFGAVALSDRTSVLKFSGYFAAAAALACVYFAWRWAYFGLLLPLPLIVKGHTLSWLSGLRWNVLPLLPLAGVTALILWRRERLGWRTLTVVLAGPVLLFASLALANQMQNLAFRFQAPVSLALLVLGFCAGRDRPAILALALLPSVAFGVRAIDREVIPLITREYVNYFPQLIDPMMGPRARIAMTEAGRFGYRLKGIKLDLVGLNSKETALGADRTAALASFAPDLVFLHQVWTLDTSGLDGSRDWIELSRARYLALRVLDSPENSYHTDPTHLGAMAARHFIETTTSPYDLYAVRYRGEFSHFYFLRGDGVLAKKDFERALDRSFTTAAAKPHCAYSDSFPCRWLAPRAAG